MNNNKFKKLSPASGLILGAAIGILFSLILNQDIALYVCIGAELGLAIGEVVSALTRNK